MLTGNPFDFQNPSRPDHFLDREAERDRLRTHIENGINVLVYGPRRRGKTSLVLRVFDGLDGVMAIYADATRMRHPGDLGDQILAGLARSGIGKAKRFQKWAQDRLRGLDIEVGANAAGAYVRLRRGTETTTGLVQALEFLERVAAAADQKIVVCLDEFQVAMTHEGLVDAVRSVAQHQEQVHYVFSGSEAGVLAALNQDRASPFYQQLLEMRIDGLRIAQMRDDSERLLGFPLTGPAVDRIDAVLGDDTKRIIHVLRHVHDIGTGDRRAIDQAIDACVADMSDAYESRLSMVTSPLHRRLLFALAEDGTDHPTASGFIAKHDLRSGAHVQRGLQSLKRLQILDDQNRFTDGLLRHYLRDTPARR